MLLCVLPKRTELPFFHRGNVGAYNSGITYVNSMHATTDTPLERRTEVACQDARTKQFETHLGWYVGLPPLEGILRRHQPGQAHLQKLHRLLDVALYHRVLQKQKNKQNTRKQNDTGIESKGRGKRVCMYRC